MKKIVIIIFAFTFLSVAIVGCGKKESDPKPTEDQTDDQVKATFVGKWERTNLTLVGYKNGKVVNANIVDKDILNEVAAEVPYHFEFSKTHFIMHNLAEGDQYQQAYKLDAKNSTILVIDNDVEWDGKPHEEKVKYTFKDKNNTLELVIILDEEDFPDEYDEYRANMTLKRISAWPTPQ